MPVPPGAPRPAGYGAVVLPVRREAMRTQGFVAVPSFRVEAPAAASPMMRKVPAPDVLSVTSGRAPRQAAVPVPIQVAASGYQALRPPTAPRRPAVPLAPRGPMGPGATTVGATSPVAAPRVVRVRTSPSPRRMDVASHGPHADAMRLPTPARAVQIPVVQSTAITALSPVHRARVILPTDRSPKASPVLRGFGFPQTVVRKAPEAKAEAKPEAKPEPLQPLQPEAAKEAAAKMSDAPKEPLSVSLDTAKEEQKETNEATKESKLEDVQAGQGEHTDSPDLLGDFRSQTSTQASEIKCDFSQSALSVPLEEEVRSVRPLPPRPQHAPDLREVLTEAVTDDPVGFAWEFLPDRHPVEAEGERRFVGECLARVGLELQVAGGLARYVQKREDLTQLHSRLEASETENIPLQVLRVVLEETLQERVRRGGQGIFVQAGVMMSMGNKKVVKIACSCDGSEGHLSVCWDWDVKLEPKCDP